MSGAAVDGLQAYSLPIGRETGTPDAVNHQPETTYIRQARFKAHRYGRV